MTGFSLGALFPMRQKVQLQLLIVLFGLREIVAEAGGKIMVFGRDLNGKEVSSYWLENKNIKMQVMDYGAALVSLIHKPTGIDTVLGFEDMDGYLKQNGSCIGASIGRVANRIAKGEFELNGRKYRLYINNNGNTLHGGRVGFDQRLFKTELKETEIVFSYLSADGEEGFPGNLEVEITYRLLEDGISIVSKGKSDQDTLFAYTNHSYFNLDCSEDARNHLLQIPSDYYAVSDENGLMTGEFEKVENTAFDFRKAKSLAQGLDRDDLQLKLCHGFDHHYPIEGRGLRRQAQLQGEKLRMTMFSDFPGFHLYSANFLAGFKGKYARRYNAYSAVCLEAEYMPNAINYPHIKEKPVVKAGMSLNNEIQYLFETI